MSNITLRTFIVKIFSAGIYLHVPKTLVSKSTYLNLKQIYTNETTLDIMIYYSILVIIRV